MTKSDTPSFAEAAEKAESSLKISEGEKLEEQTVTSEVEAESDKTEKPLKSEKTDEVEEPITKDKLTESKDKETLDQFDPDKLPEELKPLYKNLMAGFTKGRQKDREEVRALRKQIEANTPKSEPKPEVLPKFNTPQEYYTWQAKQEAKKTAEEVIKKERLESFRQQALSDYNAFDPRLNDQTEEHDPVVDAIIGKQLDDKLDDYVKENGSEFGFDVKSNVKELLEDWDKYLDSHIKNYTSRQNKLIQEKAKDFQKKSLTRSNPAKTTLSKKMSIHEAMQAALDKI